MHQAFARQIGRDKAAGAQGVQALVGDEVNSDHVTLAPVEELGSSGDAEEGVSAGVEEAFPEEMALS